MSHVTYAEEIHALETILARVRQEKAEVEKERDALAAYGEQLREALMEVAPGVPPSNAPCHSGLVSQDNCGHCSRAMKIREVIDSAPATNLARLKARWRVEVLKDAQASLMLRGDDREALRLMIETARRQA